jgi:hypothetical protein
MVLQIETAAMEQEVFKALKVGKESLEELNRQTSIEEVERLMEENAEAIAISQQISEALGGSISSLDEDALASELQSMAEQVMFSFVPCWFRSCIFEW